MSNLLDKEKAIEILKAMADIIGENKDHLTDLDAAIGDGDHGINMHRGFQAVIEKLDELDEIEDKCIGTIIKTAGMTLVSTVGGASGPLYGTAFMYAGNQVVGKEGLCLQDFAVMFREGLNGIKKRGRAEIGDKTMVDTIAPVVEFLNSLDTAEDDNRILRKIEELARQGMESTQPLIARKGRASFLKERSRDHLDPGAVSSYFLIKTIVEKLVEGV